jgi:lipopolysaccharide/colanic/teichoic acid biosynthesis glycosyltransferase
MYRLSKRLFDLVVSAVAVLLLLPALIVIALAIRLDSRGPVLYKGIRTGLNGVKFRIWKFRTMTVDAEMAGTTTHHRDRRHADHAGWKFPASLQARRAAAVLQCPRWFDEHRGTEA